MVSADELIQALQRRLRVVAPHLRRRPGEFPPGWQVWLESLRQHPGRITGAPAESIVAVLAQRPLAAAPRRMQDLTRWQAFSTLWRQQWQPPSREDRAWRWFAAVLSVLAHLIFTVVLFWLTYLQFAAAPPRKGEDIVQVELIGRGTPQETGGGALADPVDPADPTQSAEPAETTPTAETAEPVQPEPAAEAVAEPTDTPPAPVAVDRPADPADTVVPPAEAAPPSVVEPTPVEPEPAPVEQEVDVSEPVPDSSDEFVLTAPIPRVSAPELPTPELRAPASTVQVIDIPAPLVQAPPMLPEQAIAAPALSQRVPGVAPREIPTPLRAPAVTSVEPAVSAPQLQARVPQVRTVTIPTPRRAAAAEPDPSDAETSRQSAEAAAAAPAPAAEAATAAADPPASQDGTEPPAPPGGRSPEAATAGTGPEPAPAPGGWATPARDDDWGDAARNRPGAERGDDGLYNSDGSVRLAETPGSASPGAPPGAVTDEIVNLDRAGTWLKRPPIDYEPTAFDRYWRPNETLLEEWVRKSIRTVRIPIPGTNKHIVCQTVLLALGGGCGISDPNLNEQAATARPPPDIPFKPELQEDNGSIRPGTQIVPAPPLRGSGDPGPNPL